MKNPKNLNEIIEELQNFSGVAKIEKFDMSGGQRGFDITFTEDEKESVMLYIYSEYPEVFMHHAYYGLSGEDFEYFMREV